jgi:predicted DCC family thiol-disulfide oxidoreductase YuxK
MTSLCKARPVASPAGWIFFDGECRFCVATRRRWGRVFERRGFVWLPLQTPGTAERLGLGPERLMAEMWVLPVGAPPRQGVDAWIGLLPHVWWLKPLAITLRLPGLKHLARRAYRWMARHRYCVASRCRLEPRPATPKHRHTAFLEFP